MCGCRNGEIRCTRRRCEEEEDVVRDSCEQCSREPVSRVCGIDGLTYPSPCAATYCGGLAPFDFVTGECHNVVNIY